MELSVEIIEKVDADIKRGLTRERACQAAGVPKHIYRQWFAKALDAEEPYYTWVKGVEQAEAAAEAAVIEKISQATAWQASAWIAERQYPERWGQKIQLELKQELDKTLNVAQQVLPQEWYEKLLVALSAVKTVEK